MTTQLNNSLAGGFPGAPNVYPIPISIAYDPYIAIVDQTMLISNAAYSGRGEFNIAAGDIVRFISKVHVTSYIHGLNANQVLDSSNATQSYHEFRVMCTAYLAVKLDDVEMARLDKTAEGGSAAFIQGIAISAEDRRVELCMDYLFPLISGSVPMDNMGNSAGGGLYNLGTPGNPIVLGTQPLAPGGLAPLVLLAIELKMTLQKASLDGWVKGNMFMIVPTHVEGLFAAMANRSLVSTDLSSAGFTTDEVDTFFGFNIVIDRRNQLMLSAAPLNLAEILAGNSSATLFACTPVNMERFVNADYRLMHGGQRSVLNYGGKVLYPRQLAKAIVSLVPIV